MVLMSPPRGTAPQTPRRAMRPTPLDLAAASLCLGEGATLACSSPERLPYWFTGVPAQYDITRARRPESKVLEGPLPRPLGELFRPGLAPGGAPARLDVQAGGQVAPAPSLHGASALSASPSAPGHLLLRSLVTLG